MNGTYLSTVVRAIKPSICSNCGIEGHHYKNCVQPITSYGIIAFHMTDPSWNQPQRIASDELTGIPEKDIEFLLVQRRDSIGFIELLRAKYKVNDIPYIRAQILGTTEKERDALKTKSFDELWVNLWGSMSTTENRQHRQEYEQAKVKFEQLYQGVEYNGEKYTLHTLLDTTPLTWSTPEWGFPKGRRNVFETDYKCAIREFCEETGLAPSDVKIFENIEPIRETFFGNNNIHYCHVYFLAWIPRRVQVKLRPDDEMMSREIGNIGWFPLEKAMSTIRATNIEKREVLLRAYSLLRNLCAIFVGPIVPIAEQVGQTEAMVVNRSRGNEPTPAAGNPWIRAGSSHSTRRHAQFNFVEE
jgi:8-oxo-dGTP pyrophosphatase MutT (NUDIX family)